MPKKDDELTHLLLIKGPAKRMYEKRGKTPDGQGGDLLLLRGVPEPIDSFAEKDFAERLVEDRIAILVTEQGRTEEGKVHPDVRARKIAEKEATAEAEATLAAEVPGAVSVVVDDTPASPVATVSSTVRTSQDTPGAPATPSDEVTPPAPPKKP